LSELVNLLSNVSSRAQFSC